MVLVSHPHRFIFLKTSKTAGTSVEMALEHACAAKGHVAVEKTPTRMSKHGVIGSRVWPHEIPKQPALEKGMWVNHKSAEDVRNDLGAIRFDKYTKFTTVRDPFDRCVSTFHWENPKTVLAAKNFADLRHGFQDFIRSKKWKTDRKNVIIDGKFIINRVVRFEHLLDDLSLVAHDLGVAVNINAMPHKKSTAESRKDYAVADYFDQECIDIVRKRSAWLFEFCHYAERPS